MHPLNVTTLVFGLIVLGISGLWLADQAGWVDDNNLLFPLLLIGAGVVGLVAFATRGRAARRAVERSSDPDDSYDPYDPEIDEDALR